MVQRRKGEGVLPRIDGNVSEGLTAGKEGTQHMRIVETVEVVGEKMSMKSGVCR